MLTHSGEARPVRWIGRTIVRPARSPKPSEAMPVRIIADAFAPGVPCRDLVVSPGHALLIGGVFINAGELVNGATIVQEEVKLVHYFHVELDSHDILVAEGMACESYLDDGNRMSFLNGGDHVRLDGRLDRASEATCRPLVTSGPLLIAAREWLLARAIELGWRLEERPDLRLEWEGGVSKPIAVAGKRCWFVLPDRPLPTLRLRSSAAVLNRVDPSNPDGRRLGVAIGELRIDGELYDLASSCFGEGFYDREDDGCTAWRWTDGNASLSLDSPAKLIEIMLQIVQPALYRECDALQQATA